MCIRDRYNLICMENIITIVKYMRIFIFFEDQLVSLIILYKDLSNLIFYFASKSIFFFKNILPQFFR